MGEREAYRTAMEKRDPGFMPLLGAEAPESITEVLKWQIVERVYVIVGTKKDFVIRTVSNVFLKISLIFLSIVHYKDF